ncbi:MAG: type II toxin-antitoxin system HicA family toxin [Planctomycetota bacterium]|nr:type II toxin-antitoxin system HicA family toxin [Planctomycetota bacterium]
MTNVPSVGYRKIIRALQRDGWIVVCQRGSHIRLQKRTGDRTLKIAVTAHRSVKRSTLAHILKQVELNPERFINLL